MKKALILMAVSGFYATCIAAKHGVGFLWYLEDVAPEQPIAFSHVRHAGELALECTKCHQYADKGKRATVPAMSICAECHGKMETDNPEVKKLQEYLAEDRPVEWVKVHDLPWHVHFTHKRHIKAGVECRTCHGDVEGMPRMRRVRSLEMGWCVGCHRMKEASTDCLTCHK